MGNSSNLVELHYSPMPWNTMLPMNQRKLFVDAALKESQSMTEICHEYGISRKTGYPGLFINVDAKLKRKGP
jgi:hypothetical protein